MFLSRVVEHCSIADFGKKRVVKYGSAKDQEKKNIKFERESQGPAELCKQTNSNKLFVKFSSAKCSNRIRY